MDEFKRRLPLAVNGKFTASLTVRPSQAAGEWAEPVDELAGYLERIVGGPLPREQSAFKTTFTVGLDVHAKLEGEEFELRVEEPGICLVARTAAGLGHGVHFFLEELCHVRWLWPGPLGEVVPCRPDLSVPHGQWREKPDYAWRRIGVGGSAWDRFDVETAERVFLGLGADYLKEFYRWCWHNRMGGLKVADGHRMILMLPPEKFGREHPEYFALVDGRRDADLHDGKHGNQPCTSNPAVVKITADYVLSEFDARPELDAISISPNDAGVKVCQCEACRALDPDAARAAAVDGGPLAAEIAPKFVVGTGGKILNIAPVTDRMFTFANEVHAQVREKAPGKKLLMHVYGPYRHPPQQTPLQPGIIAQFTTQCTRYTDAAWRAGELDLLGRLARFAPDVGIYEYYEQGAWPGIHRIFPHLIAQSVRDFYDRGVRYFATQPGRGFATNGINFYVLAHALWNVKADIDTLIEDYCRQAFGEAADVMRGYLRAFEDRWRETNALGTIPENMVLLALPVLYDREFRQARMRELERAQSQVIQDPQKARVAFYAEAFALTDRMCETFGTIRDLRDALGADLLTVRVEELPESPTERQRELLAEFGQQWKGLLNLAEVLKGRFLYSEFWLYYGFSRASGLLERVLRPLAARWKLGPL